MGTPLIAVLAVISVLFPSQSSEASGGNKDKAMDGQTIHTYIEAAHHTHTRSPLLPYSLSSSNFQSSSFLWESQKINQEEQAMGVHGYREHET